MSTLATPNLMVDKIPKFLVHSLKLDLSLPLKSLHLKSLAEVTLRSVLNTPQQSTEICLIPPSFSSWRVDCYLRMYLLPLESFPSINTTLLTAASLVYYFTTRNTLGQALHRRWSVKDDERHAPPCRVKTCDHALLSTACHHASSAL